MVAVRQTSFSGRGLNTRLKPSVKAHQGGFAIINPDFQMNRQTQRGQVMCSESHRIPAQYWSLRPGQLSETRRTAAGAREGKRDTDHLLHKMVPSLTFFPLDTGCAEVAEPPLSTCTRFNMGLRVCQLIVTTVCLNPELISALDLPILPATLWTLVPSSTLVPM